MTLSDFVDARMQKIGFPKFDDSEIVGSDADPSVVCEIQFPGLSEDLHDGSRRVIEFVAAMLSQELRIPIGFITVFVHPLTQGSLNSLTTYVPNEKHILSWLKDNSYHGHLHMTKEETTIIRHKCVLIYFSCNLELLPEHKNRVTGELARLLLRTLISQWTGEALCVVFTHDGTRRLWKSPVQHSDKFGVRGTSIIK